MKKSEILKIIKEEVEVVLTNAEMIEFFDLDPSKLLDEMMPPGLGKGDAYGDTKEGCAAKGLSWDEEAQKCGPHEPGLEEAERTHAQDVSKLDEKDNWMKDIKSTGECTPYTKPGCKGRAKAFAKRAQHGDVRDDNLKKGKNPHGPG